jgi:hypothetical protein
MVLTKLKGPRPPVTLSQRWETKAGKVLTHTQLPLMTQMAWGITIHTSQCLTLEKVFVELGDKRHIHFNHAQLKKPKETDSMLMLKKDTEHHSQLGFQLNTPSWINFMISFIVFGIIYIVNL